MEALGLLGMLGYCSYEDIRWRRIGIIFVLFFGAAGFTMHIFKPMLGLRDMLGGMAIGLVLYAVSFISHERIGKGDALVVTVCGIYLGFWENLILLWGACIMAGIVGMVMVLRGKRKASIPFIPFLLSVYIVMLVFKGGILAS